MRKFGKIVFLDATYKGIIADETLFIVVFVGYAPDLHVLIMPVQF